MKIMIAIACTSLCSLIGCALDNEARLDEADQPSICGPTNDAQFVNSYNGTLGPSIAFVQANKGSKGAMESSPTGGKFC